MHKDSKCQCNHHNHHHNHECSCGCGHDHNHPQDKKIKRRKLLQIVIAGILFVFGIISEHIQALNNLSLYVFILSYLIIGVEVVYCAIKNIFKGNLFNEAFLMSLATICAFVVKEYSEAVAVMLLYQIGELLQDEAVEKSHESIKSLLDLKKTIVSVIREDNIEEIAAEDVKVGDVFLVKPGERITLDGTIVEGNTTIDASSLTGEALPVEKVLGEQVLSGSINLSSLIKIRVDKSFDDSTVNKIFECIENNPGNKTKSERFVAKFSKVYTPIVCSLALLIVIVPAILQLPLTEWIYKACTFLVVSCPCALVVSIPLAYFISIGVSSRNGTLVKGSHHIESLNQSKTILFDKTGTITTGELTISKVVCFKDENEMLEALVLGELYSNHPIAKSIKTLLKIDKSKYDIKDYQEFPGKGTSVLVGNDHIKVGKLEFVAKNQVKSGVEVGAVIHISKNDEYLGYVVVSDSIKSNAKEVVDELKKMQVETIIVSGDSEQYVNKISQEVGIDRAYSELLPHQKVEVLDRHLGNRKVAFIGDGINDAPAISKSDVGIVMGGLGSDAAIEVSDIVIMNDNLEAIIKTKKISRKTTFIVYENIIIVIGVKIAAIIASAFGELPMWAAIFSDVGVCILTILNSLRLFGFYKKRKNV